MIKTCRHCEDEFDTCSAFKRKVGGYIDECPDCVEEMGGDPAPVIRGFVTGDGKMAAMQILKFKNRSDAEQYGKNWNNDSGWQNKRTGSMNDIYFEKVGENIGNSNHKGKGA